MSLKLMNNAWETNFKGNDKLVLLALADNASDEGYCFPSWATIQKKTGTSKGTLSYILRAFEHFKLLERSHRHRENGSNKSNEYVIKIFDVDMKKFKEYKAEISKKKNDHSSETELPTVQKLNHSHSSETELAPSSETELLEPSIYEPSDILKEKNKKENSYVGNKSEKRISKIDHLLENLQDEKLNESETKILQGFFKYRNEIKKAIKTAEPLKAFLRELRKIHQAGFDVLEVIKLMKEKEWQTLKLEYVQNSLGSSKAVLTPTIHQKTFYAATQEQKQIKQSSTLANIARVRELRKKGQI